MDGAAAAAAAAAPPAGGGGGWPQTGHGLSVHGTDNPTMEELLNVIVTVEEKRTMS
jgi:hypothetical protein